jgi:hypothetical protein
MFSWQWIAIVFISHWVVDRNAWAEQWLQLIGGRSLTFYLEGKDDPTYSPRHEIMRGGFNVLVYTVVDNTMHLVLMFLGWKLLYA